MRGYPAALTPDPDGSFMVTFRDVPEAITEGNSREGALLRAEDALESALATYIVAKEPLPVSSEPKADEEMVPLSALGMAKTALYDAMRAQGVGRAQLARRLRCHLPQVSRLLDLHHASRMEHAEAVLAALSLRLIINVARADLTGIRRKGRSEFRRAPTPKSAHCAPNDRASGWPPVGFPTIPTESGSRGARRGS
jgi:antitoxin HicB